MKDLDNMIVNHKDHVEIPRQTEPEPDIKPEYIAKAMKIMEQEPLDVGTVEDLMNRWGLGSLCTI